MRRKTTAAIVAALCVAMAFAGCGKDGKKNEKTDAAAVTEDKSLDSTIVGKIDGVNVSQADYNIMYYVSYQNVAQYSQSAGDNWLEQEIEDGKTFADFIKENAQEQLKQIAAFEKIAEENGIKVDGDVKKTVKKQKEEIIKNYGGEDGFVNFLNGCRTTEKAFETYLTRVEIYSRINKKLIGAGGQAHLPKDEVEKKFMEENKDKWRVQHVLISTQGTDGKESKSDEEALKIAKEVIAKLDKGEDFDKLIEKYNEDPGMTKGKFYLFGAGEMVPEFEEASKNLKVGEYTKEPVKTDYGYHIIKRYDIDSSVEEFKEYQEKAYQDKVNEILEAKIKKIKSGFEDDKISKYVDSWVKELAAETKAQAEAQQQAPAPEATK